VQLQEMLPSVTESVNHTAARQSAASDVELSARS
jgi:hypothetical protein